MIESSQQGAVTVYNSGQKFNDDFIEMLRVEIDDCLRSGMPMAVINLEATRLINSRALEYLLDTGDQFRERGGQLKLAAPSPLCAEILQITEMHDELEVYDSVNTAVRSFAK